MKSEEVCLCCWSLNLTVVKDLSASLSLKSIKRVRRCVQMHLNSLWVCTEKQEPFGSMNECCIVCVCARKNASVCVSVSTCAHVWSIWLRHWDWMVPTVTALTDSGGWPLTPRTLCVSIGHALSLSPSSHLPSPSTHPDMLPLVPGLW